MAVRARQAGDEALPCAALRAAGVTFPAAVVSELELNGGVVPRVYGARQAHRCAPFERDTPVTSSVPRWRRSHTDSQLPAHDAITAGCPGLG